MFPSCFQNDYRHYQWPILPTATNISNIYPHSPNTRWYFLFGWGRHKGCASSFCCWKWPAGQTFLLFKRPSEPRLSRSISSQQPYTPGIESFLTTCSNLRRISFGYGGIRKRAAHEVLQRSAGRGRHFKKRWYHHTFPQYIPI